MNHAVVAAGARLLLGSEAGAEHGPLQPCGRRWASGAWCRQRWRSTRLAVGLTARLVRLPGGLLVAAVGNCRGSGQCVPAMCSAMYSASFPTPDSRPDLMVCI